MDLHLFSTAGPGFDIAWVLAASREVLGDKHEASVAFLPQASLNAARLLKETERAFRDLAQIVPIDTETMQLPDIEAILRRAALVYIPGGNAFLLNHRLHTSGLMPHLRKMIQNGLPVVAVSAGTVACGPNILTSNDLNMVPTPHFNGLALTPFNFNVHYDDNVGRNEWLSDYRIFHDDPVIMLTDGAYVRVKGKTAMLVQGEAWCWRAGHDKERLTPGEPIKPN
ncbi:MAG TPA: Type 1 glutamine amidotransferase-like domain-containing protein [Anaerolineales bacterium]